MGNLSTHLFTSIYDPLGTRVAADNVGPGGTRTWRLREGSYRLQVFGDNMIEVPDVRVVTDLDAFAVVNFGKLVVECFGVNNQPLNTYVLVRTDSAEKVAGGRTGEDGVIDFNLRSGLYDVFAYQANVIVRPRIQIDSQQEYVASLNPSKSETPAISSKKPAIEQITVKPIRKAAHREFEISVILSKQMSEVLSYQYRCEGGTIMGSGPTVTVRGAGNGAILVHVSVRADTGAETAGELLIPALRDRTRGP